jgi:hypothetical protein
VDVVAGGSKGCFRLLLLMLKDAKISCSKCFLNWCENCGIGLMHWFKNKRNQPNEPASVA